MNNNTTNNQDIQQAKQNKPSYNTVRRNANTKQRKTNKHRNSNNKNTAKQHNALIQHQSTIGWHQYLRDFHSKKWNIAYLSWIDESHQQNSTHLWNVYSIPLIINLSIKN